MLRSFGEKVHILCNEVKLDFARTMNKISFDKTVTHMPQKFWYVTLPEDDKAIVPSKGTCDCRFYVNDLLIKA
jgi:hypothetical protein